MSEDQRSDLVQAVKAAVRSRGEVTPADLARNAEFLTIATEVANSRESEEAADAPAMTVAVWEGPVVAGLKLRWREFHLQRRNEDGSDAGDVAFGLWVVVDDLTALLRMAMADETQGAVTRMPYFGIVWPSGESLAARLATGPSVKGKSVLDLGCGLAIDRGRQAVFLVAGVRTDYV